MRDKKNLLIVSRCLLNENAIVSERVDSKRCPPVLQKIITEGHAEIFQLPCPEMTHLGVTRWWQSYEMYDNPGYREQCRHLGEIVAEQVKIYTRKGYRIFLLSVDGSPSCGYLFTGKQQLWGGRPEGGERGGTDKVPGKGVWIEILCDIFEKEGISFYSASGQDDQLINFLDMMKN